MEKFVINSQKKQFTKYIKPLAVSLILGAALTACGSDDDDSNAQTDETKSAASEMDIKLVGRAVLSAESPEGAAEIVQYHKMSNRVFAINSSGDTATVEIVELNNMTASDLLENAEGVVTNTNLDIATTLNLTTETAGDANSIAISQDLNLLAVAIAAKTVGTKGNIAFYDISNTTPVFIKNVEVGYLPDMVTFSPDSKKVIAANEAQPSGDYLTDPEGTISIIDITDGVVADNAVEINFNSYDNKQAELEMKGMVFANPTGQTIKGQLIQTTVSMDLEPEYVTVTEDSSTAYISLQENNGIAVVNLTTNTLTDIVGLGFKDWSQFQIDASDKDEGINFQQYDNLFGMYQPDTISTYSVNGTNYIVSANEGDGREYFFASESETLCLADGGLDYDEDDGCLSYTDETRAKNLTLDDTNFANINNDNDDLGRLKVTTVKGDTDQDGDYDQLYTYGARSFTIWNTDGTVVFDSGDEIALKTAEIHGEAFNNDEDENKGDTRSDAKGAEPEALALGVINDKTYAFIGLERMSSVMMYDITDPANSTFVDYFYNRGTVEGEDISGDLAPEGMTFIAATDTTSARLIIGNEISGSIAVWELSVK